MTPAPWCPHSRGLSSALVLAFDSRKPHIKFFQRSIIQQTDGQKVHEKMPISLAVREIQIKTPVRHHLTPVKMAIIKKPVKNKDWRGCGK